MTYTCSYSKHGHIHFDVRPSFHRVVAFIAESYGRYYFNLSNRMAGACWSFFQMRLNYSNLDGIYIYMSQEQDITVSTALHASFMSDGQESSRGL